jgi:PIN domain nuclease of toxin-antitoxin system
LDFEQLEAFIQNNAVVQSPTSSQTASGETANQNPTNLPESPPDSGSEPPYSPSVKVNNQNLQMEQHMNMSTLTELHVPHHHNLLTPSTELYLASEHQHQQQQLLQINNLLHKHDAALLPSHHHQSPQDHMLLYQVNQSGQIIELNHIQHQSSRMYKGDLIELEATGPLPAIHEIQSSLQGNLNDNLQLMGENFTQLGNQPATNGAGAVKKRKNASQAFIPDGDGNLKAYIKSESSKSKLSSRATCPCLTGIFVNF